MKRAAVAFFAGACTVLAASGARAQDVGTAVRRKLDETAIAPIGRVALGPAFHVAPKADKGTELGLDLSLGSNIALNGWGGPGPIFSIEGGYAFDGIGLHAAHFTPGLGYGHPLLYISYNPRLLVGSAGDGVALGMRNGLTTHLLADLLSMEIGHQYVHDDRASQHSVRLMFGINPLAAVYALSRLH